MLPSMTPAPLIAQHGREDGRRVEAGRAHEVERPVHPDERHRVKVPDDPVVLDRLIAHAGAARPGSTARRIGTPCRNALTVGLA